VLDSLEITAEEVREEIARLVAQGKEEPGEQIPFTPRAKRSLELALREALGLGHNYIGTEHILLGLVREVEGLGARTLANFGVDAEAVRLEIIRRLPEPVARSTRPRRPSSLRRLEYRIERPSLGELTTEWLNALGAERWELTGAVPPELGGGMVFKRALPDAPAPDA
jgi:ATP-dependent Clp protease ATP-binding subunit ClpA